MQAATEQFEYYEEEDTNGTKREELKKEEPAKPEAMSRVRENLQSMIPDEGIISYLVEAVEASESEDEFSQICAPMLIEMGNIVSSDEDAAELSRAIFHLRDPPIERPIEKMSTPIIVSSLLSNSFSEDPFERDRLAQARLQVQEVGHVVELACDITAKGYKKSLKKEEKLIESVRQARLEANERENAQFRKGMGFRRPKIRRPRHLSLQDINVSIGPHTLIENSSFTMSPGNRYGLVGRNGLGKTTLMKYINSSLLRGVPDDLLIIHVEQEAPISPRTVLQTVLDCDLERTELITQLASLENSEDPSIGEKILEINSKLEEIGARDAEARASMLLSALGFSTDMQGQPLSSCSGGFRMRVSLAQALYIKPDVLMLDEPTGHLDAPSVCWLEEYLTTQCKDQILLVISHDRVFLDNVTTHIVHLKDKHLELYKGNFSSFQRQFSDKIEMLEATAEAQKKDIDHKMDFVRRLGVKAASASMAQSRLKAVEKIQVVKTISRDPPVRFEFSLSSQAAQDNIIIMEDAGFSYVPEKPIFEHMSFTVRQKTRAVVIGPNGAGKSTLINLLMGKLKPQTGFYQMVSNLRVAHFCQHHVDQLDYKITPLQFMLNNFKDQFALPIIRQHLGKFGITGEMSLQPIQSLSGGQKTRVVLAACAMTSPHLLLLDEVTNNLDMDSIEALGAALCRYTGAIVAVTHDQHFADLFANQIFICKDKKMIEYTGTFAQYRDEIKEQIRQKFFKSSAHTGLA